MAPILRVTNHGLWRTALGDALRRYPEPGPGFLLFYESREDLIVEADDRVGETCHRVRSRGFSARAPFQRSAAVYLADPVPDDVERSVRHLAMGDAVPESPPSRVAARREPEGEVLDSLLPRELLRLGIGRATGAHRANRAVGRWVGFEQRILVTSPAGEIVEDRRVGARVHFRIGRTAAGGTSAAVGEAVLSGHPVRDRESVLRVVDEAVARLEPGLAANEVRTGEQVAVLGPGVGGILVHELIGHALEADAVMQGRSWLAGRTGPVAGSELTVLDDPRRCRAPWRIDDEGTPARACALIRGGRVAGWLHDRRTAIKSKREPTGHGRRSSYREPVRPRMGATFVAPGPHRADELVARVKTGVLVRRMEAASTDPRTGRALFRVTEADRIESGRIAGRVAPHLMKVDAHDTLDRVRIADDLAFDRCIGSCHRDAQPLPVTVGAPTIWLGVVKVLV